MTTKSTITLGDLARCTITGFEGVVIAETRWLNNCVRLTLQPKKLKEDGSPILSETIDLIQLELVEKRHPPAQPVFTGGPRPEPKRPQAPR